jgi:hypothetical protein
MPSQNNYQRCIERGRALVEQYAAQSNDYGPDLAEHTSVAGDLIGDVLTYVGNLPATDLPPVYQTGRFSRVGCVAARGVWSSLAWGTPIVENHGADPDPAELQSAAEAIADYLQRA